MMQSLLPAIYPILKSSFRLDFGQVGLITLTYQLTASLNLVGSYTDRRPQPDIRCRLGWDSPSPALFSWRSLRVSKSFSAQQR